MHSAAKILFFVSIAIFCVCHIFVGSDCYALTSECEDECDFEMEEEKR